MEYLRIKYICPNQIPKGRMGMREIISKVKDGYSIALMVDQRVSEGPRALFFNKPAHTTTIPAQLALKYDCKLVPISLERKEGANFEMTVHTPYKIQKTGNDEEDTKNFTNKINQIIEKMSFKDSKATNYLDAEIVGKKIIELFEKNEFDICTIFYNQFKNVITQIPQEQQIIPLKSSEVKENSVEDNYEFEPEEDEILSNLLPKNISTQIFKAMLENSASEQGSRMTAMDSETRNAGE